MDVDDTDRQLLAALVADGRASVNDVSSRTGVAPPVVDHRIDTLERAGVIAGYEARIDYEKLGYDVTAVIQLTATDGELTHLSERLRTADQFVTVYEVTGECDVIAVGRFRDTSELNGRIGELAADGSVADVTTAVVLDAVTEDPLSPLEAD